MRPACTGDAARGHQPASGGHVTARVCHRAVANDDAVKERPRPREFSRVSESLRYYRTFPEVTWFVEAELDEVWSSLRLCCWPEPPRCGASGGASGRRARSARRAAAFLQPHHDLRHAPSAHHRAAPRGRHLGSAELVKGRRLSAVEFRRTSLQDPGGRVSRASAHQSRSVLSANNDHDFSPDGKLLAISASVKGGGGSQVFVANADGTNHRVVAPVPPSYFHGWSPDGKWLSYVANRDMKQYDVYRVSVDGGPEQRLTVDPAYDDGTDYSPDGKWIYFNSDRGNDWNIWRIPAEGAGPNDSLAQRVTNDDLEDWFPHPSPDGKSLIYLSFPANTVGHNDRNLAVKIRMIPMPGDTLAPVEPTVLVELIGGQGTINVNSWSPDSRRFGYVAYIDNQPPKYRRVPGSWFHGSGSGSTSRRTRTVEPGTLELEA